MPVKSNQLSFVAPPLYSAPVDNYSKEIPAGPSIVVKRPADQLRFSTSESQGDPPNRGYTSGSYNPPASAVHGRLTGDASAPSIHRGISSQSPVETGVKDAASCDNSAPNQTFGGIILHGEGTPPKRPVSGKQAGRGPKPAARVNAAGTSDLAAAPANPPRPLSKRGQQWVDNALAGPDPFWSETPGSYVNADGRSAMTSAGPGRPVGGAHAPGTASSSRAPARIQAGPSPDEWEALKSVPAAHGSQPQHPGWDSSTHVPGVFDLRDGLVRVHTWKVADGKLGFSPGVLQNLLRESHTGRRLAVASTLVKQELMLATAGSLRKGTPHHLASNPHNPSAYPFAAASNLRTAAAAPGVAATSGQPPHAKDVPRASQGGRPGYPVEGHRSGGGPAANHTSTPGARPRAPHPSVVVPSDAQQVAQIKKDVHQQRQHLSALLSCYERQAELQGQLLMLLHEAQGGARSVPSGASHGDKGMQGPYASAAGDKSYGRDTADGGCAQGDAGPGMADASALAGVRHAATGSAPSPTHRSEPGETTVVVGAKAAAASGGVDPGMLSGGPGGEDRPGSHMWSGREQVRRLEEELQREQSKTRTMPRVTSKVQEWQQQQQGQRHALDILAGYLQAMQEAGADSEVGRRRGRGAGASAGGRKDTSLALPPGAALRENVVALVKHLARALAAGEALPDLKALLEQQASGMFAPFPRPKGGRSPSAQRHAPGGRGLAPATTDAGHLAGDTAGASQVPAGRAVQGEAAEGLVAAGRTTPPPGASFGGGRGVDGMRHDAGNPPHPRQANHRAAWEGGGADASSMHAMPSHEMLAAGPTHVASDAIGTRWQGRGAEVQGPTGEGRHHAEMPAGKGRDQAHEGAMAAGASDVPGGGQLADMPRRRPTRPAWVDVPSSTAATRSPRRPRRTWLDGLDEWGAGRGGTIDRRSYKGAHRGRAPAQGPRDPARLRSAGAPPSSTAVRAHAESKRAPTRADADADATRADTSRWASLLPLPSQTVSRGRDGGTVGAAAAGQFHDNRPGSLEGAYQVDPRGAAMLRPTGTAAVAPDDGQAAAARLEPVPRLPGSLQLLARNLLEKEIERQLRADGAFASSDGTTMTGGRASFGQVQRLRHQGAYEGGVGAVFTGTGGGAWVPQGGPPGGDLGGPMVDVDSWRRQQWLREGAHHPALLASIARAAASIMREHADELAEMLVEDVLDDTVALLAAREARQGVEDARREEEAAAAQQRQEYPARVRQLRSQGEQIWQRWLMSHPRVLAAEGTDADHEATGGLNPPRGQRATLSRTAVAASQWPDAGNRLAAGSSAYANPDAIYGEGHVPRLRHLAAQDGSAEPAEPPHPGGSGYPGGSAGWLPSAERDTWVPLAGRDPGGADAPTRDTMARHGRRLQEEHSVPVDASHRGVPLVPATSLGRPFRAHDEGQGGVPPASTQRSAWLGLGGSESVGGDGSSHARAAPATTADKGKANVPWPAGLGATAADATDGRGDRSGIGSQAPASTAERLRQEQHPPRGLADETRSHNNPSSAGGPYSASGAADEEDAGGGHRRRWRAARVSDEMLARVTQRREQFVK
eukprot:jgi/Mesvir1/21787/Mv04180-RA.4